MIHHIYTLPDAVVTEITNQLYTHNYLTHTVPRKLSHYHNNAGMRAMVQMRTKCADSLNKEI